MKRGNDWTGISNSIIIEKGISFSSLSKAFLKRSPENTFDWVPYIYFNILLSFLGRTDGIYSHQGSTQVQILGDLNGVYCKSRYITDRDVEVNPKLPNALRGALSAGCLYQRKILPTRLPDNIHVLLRKAALPARAIPWFSKRRRSLLNTLPGYFPLKLKRIHASNALFS